jgi:ribonuclease-3
VTAAAARRELTARLGHGFARPDLLTQALTHGSAASGSDNQRLEFLGDRVLGLVIAGALLDADAGAAEGRLAPRLNALVRKETCADVAREIGLGPALRMAPSEAASGGRKKTALLGDAMEAVIGAVFLDAGYDAARALVLRLWAGRIAGAEETGADAKSALQEWVQARGLPLPHYADAGRSGADHAPVFAVEVRVEGQVPARAEAATKRAAQQAAAALLLARLERGG